MQNKNKTRQSNAPLIQKEYIAIFSEIELCLTNTFYILSDVVIFHTF